MKLVINDKIMQGKSITSARKPYYQLRGKPVTEEQAFEIIRRTDCVFDMYKIDNYPDSFKEEYIGSFHCSNSWFNHRPSGWVHPDGIIGINTHTGIKWPETSEFISEWDSYLNAFPFLNLIIAITSWDEISPEHFELIMSNQYEKAKALKYKTYDNFLENIESGLWIHDNTLEFLDEQETIEVYKEYDAKYGEKDSRVYFEDYYRDFQPDIINMDYLRRCVATYGIENTDEFIKNILGVNYEQN